QFYKGAIKEAEGYISNNTIAVMEQYFGSRNAAYKIHLMPLCPYGWGFSTTTEGKDVKIQHAMISPVRNMAPADNVGNKKTYGFAGEGAKEHYRELVVHEFTHSFITYILEEENIKLLIAQYDSLYTQLLDSAMQEQGYDGWWS